MIFDEENYIEHQILELFDTFPLHQFSKFNNLFENVDFLTKIFLILYPLLEILTTGITIT